MEEQEFKEKHAYRIADSEEQLMKLYCATCCNIDMAGRLCRHCERDKPAEVFANHICDGYV